MPALPAPRLPMCPWASGTISRRGYSSLGGLLAPLALRPRRGEDLTGAKWGSEPLIQGQPDRRPERELSSSLHRRLNLLLSGSVAPGQPCPLCPQAGRPFPSSPTPASHAPPLDAPLLLAEPHPRAGLARGAGWWGPPPQSQP